MFSKTKSTFQYIIICILVSLITYLFMTIIQNHQLSTIEQHKSTVLDLPDRYVPVENTNIYPFSSIVHIEKTVPTGKVWGTGVIIGPNKVLTSAHIMVEKDDSDAIQATTNHTVVYTNHTADNFTACADVQTFYIAPKYYTDPSAKNDLAILELKRPIGVKNGIFPINYAIPTTADILITSGYPGGKQSNQMYTSPAPVYHADTKEILIDTKSYGGASGSPVYTFDNQLVGIWSGGYPGVSTVTPLTAHREFIEKYINNKITYNAYDPAASKYKETNDPITYENWLETEIKWRFYP